MIKQKYLFIIDDNLCIEPEYAKQVFDRIAPLKKRWGMQASTLIAKDEEMLEKMANAGCFNVTLGLQSINEKTVDEGKFFHNRVEEYRNIIEKINSYGIVVQAFFMFGFDNDDKNIFRDTMRAIRELNIDDVIMYILTPYPGTDYFAEFEADNRILTYDWSKYSWWNCVYKPKNMTETELEEGLRWAYGELNKDCRKRLPSRIWKYRKLFFDDLAITGRLIKGYIHNKVDPQKMP